VLSRLLFGSSITNISAVEALQLGAAVASLRGGGGGLDPINKLRSAIGLDRLRIVGSDPVTGRGTSIAVGKYLGRRFFVELVTDGQGYSATSLEFRVTKWLALLATISTVGNDSVNVKVSKDY
jgi:translocation and assembly module TamB